MRICALQVNLQETEILAVSCLPSMNKMMNTSSYWGDSWKDALKIRGYTKSPLPTRNPNVAKRNRIMRWDNALLPCLDLSSVLFQYNADCLVSMQEV